MRRRRHLLDSQPNANSQMSCAQVRNGKINKQTFTIQKFLKIGKFFIYLFTQSETRIQQISIKFGI